jgi:hypothetical protein
MPPPEQHGESIRMRAEIEALAAEIKDSIARLRRHL